MTTNIMNKITAALSMKPSTLQSTSNNVTTAKINDVDDEYHTLFTKRLSNESDLNSTTSTPMNSIETDHQSFFSLDDFIGGPLNDEYSSIDYGRLSQQSNPEQQNSDFIRSITTTPADSSCGFHNTFSVLEKHLNKNKQQLKLSQHQIEYLLMQNKDEAVQNDIYIDIPINRLHAINGQVNGSLNDGNGVDETPSLFELEFEAMERLRAMWGGVINNEQINEQNQIEHAPPTNIINASLVEELYQQDDNDYCSNGNEYIYHVAKSRNGQLYIRVRRNIRLDQGKNIRNIFSIYQTVDENRKKTIIETHL